MDKLQPYAKYAVLFAFLGISLKLILYLNGWLDKESSYSAMGYLLFLLLAIFFTIRKEDNSQLTAINEVKYAMRSVGLFALAVAVFTYCFYEFIAPEIFIDRLNERLEVAQTIDLDKIESPKKMKREEVIANEMRISKMFFSSFNHSSITLFSFLIVGGIYSTILVLVKRKLLRRR